MVFPRQSTRSTRARGVSCASSGHFLRIASLQASDRRVKCALLHVYSVDQFVCFAPILGRSPDHLPAGRSADPAAAQTLLCNRSALLFQQVVTMLASPAAVGLRLPADRSLRRQRPRHAVVRRRAAASAMQDDTRQGSHASARLSKHALGLVGAVAVSHLAEQRSLVARAFCYSLPLPACSCLFGLATRPRRSHHHSGGASVSECFHNLCPSVRRRLGTR